MQEYFRRIISSNRRSLPLETIGISRTGLPLHAARFGVGPTRISLIAGMHADEPAGPLLLSYLCGYLAQLPPEHGFLQEFSWWIVPHGNPDGEECNAEWFHHTHHTAEIGRYLTDAVREKPGDDLEFGFPRDQNDTEARPETRAIVNWWQQDDSPFSLHVSLHGMAFAGGCWYLLQPDSPWDQSELQKSCTRHTARLGYVLHDVERNGEKGFFRIAPGFCTHPNSTAMQNFFIENDQPELAPLMRPSSMETIRAFGGQPLTLVSEIPLFMLPGVGLELGPPDPVAEQWKEQIALWRKELSEGVSSELITRRAEASGIQAVPFDHQMELQWYFILAGLQTVAAEQLSAIAS